MEVVKKYRRAIRRGIKPTIRLGMDYAFRSDGSPVLLEMNIKTAPGRTGLQVESQLEHFIHMSTYKDHQHQIFGELMPDFVLGDDDISKFVEEKGDVVYKGISGSQGNGVKINKPLNDESPLDFIVEEFIMPKTMELEGELYPYVIREEIFLELNLGNITARKGEVFRKRGVKPIDINGVVDKRYKLNIDTFSSIRCPIDQSDAMAIDGFSEEVLDKIVTVGSENGWNPTNIYDDVLIGYHFGRSKGVFQDYPDKIFGVQNELMKMGLHSKLFPSLGRLDVCGKISKYGVDMMIISNYYSFKPINQRIRVTIEQRDGEIWEDEGFSISVRDNLAVIDRHSTYKLVDKILENHDRRRKN